MHVHAVEYSRRRLGGDLHKDDASINALYTISQKGIGKITPGAKKGTQEETSLNFPNAAEDGCKCPELP